MKQRINRGNCSLYLLVILLLCGVAAFWLGRREVLFLPAKLDASGVIVDDDEARDSVEYFTKLKAYLELNHIPYEADGDTFVRIPAYLTFTANQRLNLTQKGKAMPAPTKK